MNLGGSNGDLGDGNEANGCETLQQLRGELRRLAPVLEHAVGALTVVQRSIIDDEAVGVSSSTVRYAAKVDGALDVLKGVLAGISVKKLRMAISHAVMEKRDAGRLSEDGRWAGMGWSWHDVAGSAPPFRRAPLEWDAAQTIILLPTDENWMRSRSRFMRLARPFVAYSPWVATPMRSSALSTSFGYRRAP